MKRKMIIAALAVCTAALSGCNQPEDGSGFWNTQNSSGESASVSVSSKAEPSTEGSSITEPSTEESSIPEPSAAASSVIEPSVTESSIEESSEEESSDTQYDEEYEQLERYMDNQLIRSGAEEYPYVPADSGYELIWEVLSCGISDYNNDGSPELVVQYGVSPNKEWKEQGIALRIIKYQDGDFKFYQAKEFLDYTRIAGAGYAEREIVDELYVDENGDLAILHTRTAGTSPVSAVYYTYSLRNGTVEQTGELRISREEYYGQLEDQMYGDPSYAVSLGKCCVFYFSQMNEEPPAPLHYLTTDEAVKIQKEILDIKLIDQYEIKDSIVDNMIEKYGYDITKAIFVSYDEMVNVYFSMN